MLLSIINRSAAFQAKLEAARDAWAHALLLLTAAPGEPPPIPPGPRPPTGPYPPPIPPPPTGGIMTRFGPAPDEFSRLVRREFPSEQWVNAAEVAHIESGWRATAHNDTTKTIGPCGTRYQDARGNWNESEDSRGFFQINTCVHKQYAPDLYFRPDINVNYAAQLWRSSGWYPWSTTARRLGLI